MLVLIFFDITISFFKAIVNSFLYYPDKKV